MINMLDLVNSSESSPLEFYLNLLIAIAGLIANTISIFIFCKKRLNKKTNIGYLHSILCVYNACSLLSSVFISDIIVNQSNVFCKLLNFWRRLIIDLSSFQQLYITCILFLCVKHPKKFINLQNNRKTAIALLVMILFLILTNTPFLFYEIKSATELNLTKISKGSDEAHICYASVGLASVAIISNIFIRYVIPLIVILALNLIILDYFNSSKNFFLRQGRRNKPKNFLRSIFILNFLFFLAYLPWAILSILMIYVEFDHSQNANINYRDKLIIFWENTSISLSYVNYMSPFFVHIIYNRIFKVEFMLAIKKISEKVCFVYKNLFK